MKLRGGNYPHRGLKLQANVCTVPFSSLRGGNYLHRGLKHVDIAAFAAAFDSSRRKLSPSGIETEQLSNPKHRYVSSRRKLSPSGIETNTGSPRKQTALALRGGNYPHRVLKPSHRYPDERVGALRGGNYPHRGLKPSLAIMAAHNMCAFAEETIPIGD